MVLLIVTLLVVGRSLVFVIFEHAQFDADQAITGLMAKHIAELRAFPFYAYASDYVLVVEAWLAAPFLALFGTSVAALRLPLVLLNLVTGVLLVTILGRELYLRPVVALIPALFFVAAPPVLAAELLTATGGNVEPFVYVLLLWLTRERPVAFGIIFLVGFMNREFTAYAASALLLVEALQGRLWQIDNLRQKAVVLGVVAVGWLLTGPLRTGADAMGPGTAGMSNPSASNVSVAVGFLCPSLDLSRMGANLTSLVTTQMGTLLGVAPFRLRDVNINSPTRQGMGSVARVLPGHRGSRMSSRVVGLEAATPGCPVRAVAPGAMVCALPGADRAAVRGGVGGQPLWTAEFDDAPVRVARGTAARRHRRAPSGAGA